MNEKKKTNRGFTSSVPRSYLCDPCDPVSSNERLLSRKRNKKWKNRFEPTVQRARTSDLNPSSPASKNSSQCCQVSQALIPSRDVDDEFSSVPSSSQQQLSSSSSSPPLLLKDVAHDCATRQYPPFHLLDIESCSSAPLFGAGDCVELLSSEDMTFHFEKKGGDYEACKHV